MNRMNKIVNRFLFAEDKLMLEIAFKVARNYL